MMMKYSLFGCQGCSTDCLSTMNSTRLDCRLNQSMSSTECPAQRCAGDRQIGNTSTSGCETTTCDYAGYTNSSANRFQILATLTTNKTILCNSKYQVVVAVYIVLLSI